MLKTVPSEQSFIPVLRLELKFSGTHQPTCSQTGCFTCIYSYQQKTDLVPSLTEQQSVHRNHLSRTHDKSRTRRARLRC